MELKEVDKRPWVAGSSDSRVVDSSPRVPLLCNDEAETCDDLDDFDIWPKRRGWDGGLLRILSSWLARKFCLEDWICQLDSRYINSTALTELLLAMRSTFFERRLKMSEVGFRTIDLTVFGKHIYEKLKKSLHKRLRFKCADPEIL